MLGDHNRPHHARTLCGSETPRALHSPPGAYSTRRSPLVVGTGISTPSTASPLRAERRTEQRLLCLGERSASPPLTSCPLRTNARNAAELMTLSATLQQAGIQLELLTGPLTGIYDPTGMGSMLFAILAVAAQLDRDYIREKTLEGQKAAAAARGNHGGRPVVIDPDSLIYARALRDAGTPIPKIATKLTIKTGKNTGRHPSVASVYRALADTDEGSTSA
ncbi:MAG TPA: recombinase family protein [Candidatus Limnocylindrales bacterium]